MKPKRLPIGTKVTCKYPVEAFYSGYAGKSIVVFRPGTVGTIRHNNTPPVRGPAPFLYIVDFIDPASRWRQSGGSDTQRVSLHPDNIEKINNERQ